MAPPADSGVKVRGPDLLEALRMRRLTDDMITPVVPGSAPPVASKAGGTSQKSLATDAFYEDLKPALLAFVNTLDDGATPRAT